MHFNLLATRVLIDNNKLFNRWLLKLIQTFTDKIKLMGLLNNDHQKEFCNGMETKLRHLRIRIDTH